MKRDQRSKRLSTSDPLKCGIRRTIIIAFIVVPLLASGQSKADFGCNLINTFKTQDSSAFISFVIPPSDNQFIVEKMLNMKNNTQDSVYSQSDSAWKVFQLQVMSAFNQLYNRSVALGVNWKDVNCRDFVFTDTKLSPSFPTLEASISLSKNKRVLLSILSAIEINGKWRITGIDIKDY